MNFRKALKDDVSRINKKKETKQKKKKIANEQTKKTTTTTKKEKKKKRKHTQKNMQSFSSLIFESSTEFKKMVNQKVF